MTLTAKREAKLLIKAIRGMIGPDGLDLARAQRIKLVELLQQDLRPHADDCDLQGMGTCSCKVEPPSDAPGGG